MIIADAQKCCGCAACMNICPASAITMQENNDGFLFPLIDDNKCKRCNLCVNICPVQVDNIKKDLSDSTAYAVQNNNEKVRSVSSSGGVFSLLAENIINQGGIVSGAEFEDAEHVHHTIIDNKSELNRIYGSKYIQSETQYVYKKIKNELDNKRKVLFCGTPCQVAGLKCYLKKDYDELILIDLICHGVPSAKVWREFLKDEIKTEEIQKINFRDKRSGWKNYSLYIETINNKSFCRNFYETNFFKAFLSNIALRPSCYNCKFKYPNNVSDITLGDFWGIEDVYPELDDDTGTSAVIINTEKGNKLWDAVKESCKYKNVDINTIIKCNTALTDSVTKHPKYELFFKLLEKIKFKNVINICLFSFKEVIKKCFVVKLLLDFRNKTIGK